MTFDLPYHVKILWERLHILRVKSKASIQYVSGVWFGIMLLRYHLPLRFEQTYTDPWIMQCIKHANSVLSGKQKTSVAKFWNKQIVTWIGN